MYIKAILDIKNICGFIYSVYFLLRHAHLRQFAGLWIRSLLPWHTFLSDQVPWIPFKAGAWLESYLKPHMSVFEYGSGGSTIFFAKRVNNLVSVEHDKYWYSKISSIISKEGISNCEYLLFEPEKIISGEMPRYGCKSYTSKETKYAGMSFKDYVKSIENYPDGSFDLVFVDGYARPPCILSALSKIRSGGYLMLDNSERSHYRDAISLLADCKRRDFFGIGPRCARLSQTSVWKITSIDNSNRWNLKVV